MGSFLSVSSVQMDEIAAGLRKSGVRFIWPVRGETDRIKEVCGDMGLVVPWCDQLRVGWRVRKVEDKIEHLVTREEVAGLVKKFMDLEDDEGKEMRRRAGELKQLCHDAIAEGGSSHTNIKAFIRHFAEGVA